MEIDPTSQRAAKFIMFAVKQAKEAQAFGFTRNEASRNLKSAIHQYWQHRFLGLSGISQKGKIPRSKAAIGKKLSKCVVEHVVPLKVFVDILMDMETITETAIVDLLTRFYVVRLVTLEENDRLTKLGLRFSMPKGWNGKDVFARYAASEIDAPN